MKIIDRFIKGMNQAAAFVSKAMVYIILVILVVAFFFPGPFIWAKARTTELLSIIMFCMGMTLDVSSFKAVAKNPKAVLLGLVIQFTICPLIAYGLSLAFNLSTELLVGFVLLGATPGGTASNVMTFLADGDVALTVSMTALSTLLAAVVTPAIVLLLVGQYTPVSFMAMLISVLKVVAIPVFLGVIVHQLLRKNIDRFLKGFVLISSVSIFFIVGGMVAAFGKSVLASGATIVILVLIHNLLGYAGGYGIATLFKVDEKQKRSITFQVGMKNTGLAITLANSFFTPLSAIPAVAGIVIHQITGPLLAGLFVKRPIEIKEKVNEY